MKWWECHHCQRPIFSHRRLLSKVSLATHVGLCMTSRVLRACGEHFLKERCPTQTICQAWKTSTNSFAWISNSSVLTETIQVERGSWRSVVKPSSQSSLSSGPDHVAQSWKSFACINEYKSPNCVFFFPPPTYFSPRKLIQLFLIKAFIFQQVPFPHCLVSFMRKRKKKARCPKVFNLWIPPKQSISRLKTIREPKANL